MVYRAALFLFLTGCLSADVELTFLPNKSVEQESVLTVDLQQQLPYVPAHTKMVQKLVADVKIVDRSDLPVSRPPMSMLFILRDLGVKMLADGREAKYQVGKPGTSLFLAEVHDMIGEPIKLRFDDHFRLMPDTPGLVQLSKELPILGQIHPQSLIEELFQHQFALAGRSLEAGASFVDEIDDPVGLQPRSITYTVTEINDREIVATMRGEVPSTFLNMDKEFAIGDDTPEVFRFCVEGLLSGTVRWNRSNALRYTLEAVTSYRGVYQLADWEWDMNLTIEHQVNSL